MTASVSVRSGSTQSRAAASRQDQPSPENAKKWRKSRGNRTKSYIAQAFILFNIWGIPLSFGPYLVYYHANTWRHPVLQTSSIIGLQLFCIFGAGIPVLWLYQQEYWRTTMLIASLTASICQWALYVCTTWKSVILVQGFGVGISLGVLYSMGSLVLSSHYKYNYPLTSTMSVSAGLLGAVMYTCIALGLVYSPGLLKTAYILNAILTTTTLCIACLLVKRSDVTFPTTTFKVTPIKRTIIIKTNNYTVLKRVIPPPHHRNPFLESGTWLFFLGYLLTFAGVFIYPVYSILLLSNSPSHTLSTTPTWHLTITYAFATLTAPYAASRRLRTTLGPVNTFMSATLLAASCTIVPVWLPYPNITLAYDILYGIALGVILSLHTKVLSVFHWSSFCHHDDMPARAAVVQTAAGMFVAAGIVWTGWVVDHTAEKGRLVFKGVELGFGVAGTVAAYTMFAGAVLMGMGRWRRCPRLYIAV
jgi:MFS family permease